VNNYLVNLVCRGAGLAPRNLLEPVITPDSLPITGLPLHDGGDILPETHGEWFPVAPRVEPLSPQASSVPVASVSPLAPSVLRPPPNQWRLRPYRDPRNARCLTSCRPAWRGRCRLNPRLGRSRC
jgi:hypothetical protein